MSTFTRSAAVTVVAALLTVGSAVAQKPGPKADPKGDPSKIMGGLGMTWIDGEAYYLINLAPELAFGNFGVGLDLNLRISSKDQKIRKADFDETYDYVRIIRYLRWGHKGDNVYARLGALDYSRLGHGSIMYLYKNSPSYDERRMGMEFDLNFDRFGFETVYSDFARAGVFGLRGYVRPLQYTTLASIPVIGGLEVGATWAGDFRTDSKDVDVDTTGGMVRKRDNGAISIVGFDLGLPLLRFPVVDMTLYFDYAKIVNFGSGSSLGLETNLSGLGVVKVFTKFERRWPNDQFLPAYFDAFYELERYQLAGTRLISKAGVLANLKSPGPGYFGDIMVDVLGTIQIRGMYQKLDVQPESGTLHLETSLGEKIPLFIVSAGYDKRNIKDNKDVFTLDNRSLLYVDVGYKPYPFMIVSTLYVWTFEPEKDPNGNVSYRPVKHITPKVSLVFPL